MLSVADELWITGLPDEQRAIVERYAATHSVADCGYCGAEVERPKPKPSRSEMLYAYQQGYRLGFSESRSGRGETVPAKLPASMTAVPEAA